MKLTPEQILEMQSKGLSMQEIEILAEQKGLKMPDNKTALDKASGILNAIFGGGKIGEAIGTLGGLGITAAKEKLGLEPKGITEAYSLEAPTPIQTIADVAQAGLTVAGLKGIGQAGGLAARTLKSAALGAGLAGTKEVAEDKELKEIAKSAAIGAGVGATIPLIGEGFKQFGRLLGKTGEKIQMTVIKPTQADIKDGFKIETIKKYNLGGSLKTTLEKTDNLMDNLSEELTVKLKGTKESLDLNKVYENTAKRILGNKFESFGANSSIDKALENLRNEITSVAGENGLVSIPEAQQIKRASGHFGAWLFGQVDPESTARQKIYNVFYNEMKSTIEKTAPEGIKEINKKLAELIPVMNALIRRIPVAERNAALSLTDIITLSAATLEPRALGLSLLNLASKSGAVGAGLSKIGEKIQQITPLKEVIGRGARVLLPKITNQLE